MHPDSTKKDVAVAIVQGLKQAAASVETAAAAQPIDAWPWGGGGRPTPTPQRFSERFLALALAVGNRMMGIFRSGTTNPFGNPQNGWFPFGFPLEPIQTGINKADTHSCRLSSEVRFAYDANCFEDAVAQLA